MRFRQRLAAGLMAAGVAVAVLGQEPPRPAPAPAPQPAERTPDAQPVDAALGKPQQALIDRFLEAMPRDPSDLRKAEVRERIAGKCLPVLQQVQEFAAANPKSLLAERVAEFRIYAVVLGDADLRTALTRRRDAGDRAAAVQLAAADVIVAAEAASRGKAVAALAASIARRPDDSLRPGDETGPGEVTEPVFDCAVQCLTIAAGLDEHELATLASPKIEARIAKRFADLAERQRRDPARLVGKPFVITGRTMDGAEFSTATLRGKVVVVDFWATWCGPCVRAMPELVRVRQAVGTDRLAVVGVSCDADEASLRKFVAEHRDVDWPQLFEPGQERWHPVATKLGISSIPRVLVIDGQGRLVHADAGKDLETIVRDCLAR